MAGSTVGAEGGAPRSAATASLWRAKWAILAVVLIAFVAGYQYSKDQPATYTATSRVVLSAAQPFDPLGTYSYNDPTRYVADQVAIVTTQTILVPAAQLLATATPPDPIDPVALADSITALPSSTNSVIVINATSAEPAQAVARANAVASAYEGYLANQVRGVLDASVTATTDPQTIQTIRAKAAAFGDGVAVVETAAAGSADSSLTPMRSALLIAAVAALVAIGLSLLWRSPPPDGSAVVNAARTRVLGEVPGRALRHAATPRPQEHALALVALDYARRGVPGPVLVTGTSARSGAASVAHGLAVSATAQGRRVLLIDADPGRRELLRAGAKQPARSLEELGRPGVGRDDVLAPAQAAGDGELVLAKVGTDGSTLLDGPAVGRALDELAGSFDLVLVQSGPVPTSPVAFGMAEYAGGVVAVTRRRSSPRPVVELRERLETARRPLVGLVFTGRGLAARWASGQSSAVPAPAPAAAPGAATQQAPAPAAPAAEPPQAGSRPAEATEQAAAAPAASPSGATATTAPGFVDPGPAGGGAAKAQDQELGAPTR